MKKLIALTAIAACGAALAIESANIVGYQTIDAPAAGKYVALAIQFEGIGEVTTLPISSLVTVGAPKGAKSIGVSADQIWLWDSASADWIKYYYRSSNASWCKSGTSTATTDTVKNGDTVFFYRGTGGTDTTLTLSGGVSEFTANPVYSGLTAGKYYMMAYPWPVAMSIANFKSYQGAPKGAKSIGVSADQIWRWDTTNNDWIKYFYRSSNTSWCASGTQAETEDTIPAGEGFFFYRGTGGSVDTVTFTYE